MNRIHNTFREKELSRREFIRAANEVAEEMMGPYISQWLVRGDLPEPEIRAVTDSADGKWHIILDVVQPANPWKFTTSVLIETQGKSFYKQVIIDSQHERFTFSLDAKPTALHFNALNDIPLIHSRYFTWSNFYDDFHNTQIVYGTKRQIEANHTLALRFSTMLADRFSEILIPVVKDVEISEEQLKSNDLIVTGSLSDNALMADIVTKYGLDIGKNVFSWQDMDGSSSDQGLFLALPNPWNTKKAAYLYISNSALELYQMTKDRYSLPSWAVFHGDQIKEKGFHENNNYIIRF